MPNANLKNHFPTFTGSGLIIILMLLVLLAPTALAGAMTGLRIHQIIKGGKDIFKFYKGQSLKYELSVIFY